MTSFHERRAGKVSLSTLLASAAVLVLPLPGHAHGIAGDRVFPATIATDDPAAASEASLPTVAWESNPRNPDGTIPSETDVGAELDVEVLPHFAIGIAPTYTSVTAKGNPGGYGFQNTEVSGKYEFYDDAASETIMSAGLVTDIGGTGSKSLGEDSGSTFTPTYYFGKGFGDLPDSMAMARPFAITGTMGLAIPQNRTESDVFQPGIAVEYSMPYLKSAVKDYSLPDFVNHLIPVVEVPLNVGLDHGDHGVTGTVNPGVIYLAETWQFGLEATMPITSANQHGVGVIGQFHVFLDDLLPAIFGQPLFGGNDQ
jgi:hypothetical protein